MKSCIILFCLIAFSSCTKELILADSWSSDCECSNSKNSDFRRTEKYLYKIRQQVHFDVDDRVIETWKRLNEEELHHHSEYRLTIVGSYSVRVRKVDTTTTFYRKIYLSEGVVHSSIYEFGPEKWEEFTLAMDTLFWKQDYQLPYDKRPMISDGMTYTVEGFSNGQYKMIRRDMDEEIFDLFSSSLHYIKPCKTAEIGCL